MDPFEHQLQSESRRIRLLEGERQALRARVLASVVEECAPTPSPYVQYLFPVLRGVAISFSLLLVAIGPVTYGAQVSSPGDLLHQLEVGVVEPVEESLRLTTAAKRTFHTERLEERLAELKKVDGKALTAEDSGTVLAEVVEHAEAAVADEEQEDSPKNEQVSHLARTAALLAAHEEVLEDFDIKDQDLEQLSEEVEKRIKYRTREYVEGGTEAEVAAEIAKKLDLADEALPEISARRTSRELEGRFERIEKAVREGELDEAFEKATEVEIELLKETYLRKDER